MKTKLNVDQLKNEVRVLNEAQLRKIMGGQDVDFTDPTKPQFGGPVGSASGENTPTTPQNDPNLVTALDGNPTL